MHRPSMCQAKLFRASRERICRDATRHILCCLHANSTVAPTIDLASAAANPAASEHHALPGPESRPARYRGHFMHSAAKKPAKPGATDSRCH
jgi:hypothetical protein